MVTEKFREFNFVSPDRINLVPREVSYAFQLMQFLSSSKNFPSRGDLVSNLMTASLNKLPWAYATGY